MAINTAKYENVILRLAQDLGGQLRGKKKLAKLLYFVDFDFFEKNEQSVTGDSYRRLPMGPVPDKMDKIISGLEKKDKITIEYEQERPDMPDFNPTVVFSASANADETVFEEGELEMVDRVAKRYGNLFGKQLEDLTHAEAPYIGTQEGEEISYELSFYRGTDVAA